MLGFNSEMVTSAWYCGLISIQDLVSGFWALTDGDIDATKWMLKTIGAVPSDDLLVVAHSAYRKMTKHGYVVPPRILWSGGGSIRVRPS